jgi:glycosyltransferase involved in cell wall biosynthesis
MFKLSIVIPAYNEGASILGVLEAVAAQRRPSVEFEVLVVDDGSTDRTVEIVR